MPHGPSPESPHRHSFSRRTVLYVATLTPLENGAFSVRVATVAGQGSGTSEGVQIVAEPESASAAADHRSGPRRRGDVLEAAILDATIAELTEVGYWQLTMEGVAARAHTGKASLYKRWPNRAELVVAALRHHGGPPLSTPTDTGSLREDVLALLRRGAKSLNGLFGEAVRGLMAESLRSPEDTAQLRANMFTSRNRLMREILERAAARGEIPADAINPRVISFAPALVDHHFLIHGAPIPDEVLTDIVDSLLLPLLVSDPGSAGRGDEGRGRDASAPTDR
ncbi:MAG: TetR/AcrR family transcriptional regulator [Catenulispora sp.]|nr:TetR/AcrR family transcriptional regulator [Catenulispora sp.]